MQLRLRHRCSIIGESWWLERVVDAKVEATGFHNEREARRWAIEQGHEVIE